MKIKKYEVTDMKEALRQIKEELGSDAVILTTKKIMKPTGLGLFPRAVLEVTAAVDYEKLTSNNGTKAPAYPKQKVPDQAMPAVGNSPVYQSPTLPRHNIVPEPKQAKKDVDVAIDNDTYLKALLEELTISPAAPGSAAELLPGAGEELYKPPRQQIEAAAPQKYDVTTKLEDMLKAAGLNRLPELFDEIRGMKQELSEMRKALDEPVNINVNLPQHLKEHYAVLVRNGLDDFVAYRLMKNIEKDTAELIGKAQMKNMLIEKLGALIPVESEFVGALHNKVTAFVGPTGVGKTTTIAKLAANLVLRYGQKVCLITVDNFRIGAVDQLKTYADIVRLPLYVATGQSELSNLLSDVKDDYDYILLDSTGRSPYDASGVADAVDLLSAVPDILPVLVLSIASNQSELGDMYERYAGFSPQYIIFTKLDETRYFGPLANLAIKKKTPLLLLSNGQGVPEDMEIPDGKKIAKKLLQEIPGLWKEI